MDRTKIFACLIAAGLLTGCSRGPRPITVGSKNFTEQLVLGEIAAQHLENRLNVPVRRMLNLAGTLVAHQAILAGQIDLYPEYTGTALSNVLKLPADYPRADVAERVRQEYERRFNLVWIPPLGFANGFAMSVRGTAARDAKIETLSEAAKYQPGWLLGVGYEFLERPDGYAALMKAYNLPLKGAPKTMDLGLVYRALDSKQINMAAGSETDGLLSVVDAKVLRDDKGAFPPYDAAYVVRAAALAEHPGMRDALAELSGKFDSQLMRKLNYAVDGEHRTVADVAKDFLKQAGLAQ